MQYRILNENREIWKVDQTGAISRPEINLKASGQWLARALVRFNNFGHVVHTVPFDKWDEFIASKPQWHYKNGKPRYHLVDFDHGSERIHSRGVIAVDTAAN